MRLIPALLLPAALLLGACGGGQAPGSFGSSDASAATAEASLDGAPIVSEIIPDAAGDSVTDGDQALPAAPSAPPPEAGALSPLADQIVALPPAGGVPEERASRQPVSMDFEAIGVTDAPIDPVGVIPNGEMEIPGGDRVGWYSYGASPGEVGSAVLAAHIAFDGEQGVFRYLADSENGDRFTVRFDDGTASTYQIVERAQYDKDELPFERVFARSGDPVITLISCGGQFQPSQASYQDNIVAYAVPVA